MAATIREQLNESKINVVQCLRVPVGWWVPFDATKFEVRLRKTKLATLPR